LRRDKQFGSNLAITGGHHEDHEDLNADAAHEIDGDINGETEMEDQLVETNDAHFDDDDDDDDDDFLSAPPVFTPRH